jgi:hypothetical protein
MDPLTMMSGGPTQTAISVTRAAGINPIITLGWPLMIGPPTCGIGGTEGSTIGQTCISVIRAAGSIITALSYYGEATYRHETAAKDAAILKTIRYYRSKTGTVA